MQELSELIVIFKTEISEGNLTETGEAGTILFPILTHILADVQERMIYRAQTFLRDEVGNYTPSSFDTDYPNKLVMCSGLTTNSNSFEGSSTWYPPLEKTLNCLSCLYRCIETSTFSGLAQEAISLCIDNITLASKVVSRVYGVIDGQLFLIKHLLILREQIAPFNAEFAIDVKELDFSHVRGQMRRIITGELSFFTLTQENALLVLASEGRPQVLESTINSKKELEKKLKTGCEAFIMSVTKKIVEPMLRFIAKVTAFQLSEDNTRALSSTAFASEEKIEEMVNNVNDSLNNLFPQIIKSLKLYVQGIQTQSLIFKPICSNILEAHIQLINLLAPEYSSETLKRIGLVDPTALNSLFEKVVS